MTPATAARKASAVATDAAGPEHDTMIALEDLRACENAKRRAFELLKPKGWVRTTTKDRRPSRPGRAVNSDLLEIPSTP